MPYYPINFIRSLLPFGTHTMPRHIADSVACSMENCGIYLFAVDHTSVISVIDEGGIGEVVMVPVGAPRCDPGIVAARLLELMLMHPAAVHAVVSTAAVVGAC